MGCCCEKEEQASAMESCAPKKPKRDLIFWSGAIGVGFLYLLHLLQPAFLSTTPWLHEMAATTHHMLGAVWWGVLVGFFFVGILSKVPRDFVMALLGPGGTIKGLLRATGAGVLLDLCSHGILMVGVRLYERGASAGQVIAFLLASPWNSFSLTLILIGLIGLPWTLVFIAASMLIALITGWFFDRLVARGTLPANPHHVQRPAATFHFGAEAKSAWQATHIDAAFIKDMVANGLRDSRMVVRWLLIGILLAALLRAFVDTSVFQTFFGPSLLGLFLTLAFTTVIEVCSEGSTPIAADLVTRAHAPGNGFTFLMAGVATDYTEIMVLKDAAKSWKLALFLPLISVPQVMLVGWLMNNV